MRLKATARAANSASPCSGMRAARLPSASRAQPDSRSDRLRRKRENTRKTPAATSTKTSTADVRATVPHPGVLGRGGAQDVVPLGPLGSGPSCRASVQLGDRCSGRRRLRPAPRKRGSGRPALDPDQAADLPSAGRRRPCPRRHPARPRPLARRTGSRSPSSCAARPWPRQRGPRRQRSFSPLLPPATACAGSDRTPPAPQHRLELRRRVPDTQVGVRVALRAAVELHPQQDDGQQHRSDQEVHLCEKPRIGLLPSTPGSAPPRSTGRDEAACRCGPVVAGPPSGHQARARGSIRGIGTFSGSFAAPGPSSLRSPAADAGGGEHVRCGIERLSCVQLPVVTRDNGRAPEWRLLRVLQTVQGEDEDGLAGGDGDVLAAVDLEGEGVGPDEAAGLEAPQRLAGAGVEGEEVALAVAAPDQPAAGRQHAARGGRVQRELPGDLAGQRVDRLDDPVVLGALDVAGGARPRSARPACRGPRACRRSGRSPRGPARKTGGWPGCRRGCTSWCRPPARGTPWCPRRWGRCRAGAAGGRAASRPLAQVCLA